MGLDLWDAPHGRQRVRVVTREDDEDGDWSVTAVSDPIDGCSIQHRPGTESYTEGQRVRQPWLVIGPRDLARARAWDCLDLEHEPGSEVWERAPLQGRPRPWPGDDGTPGHVEVDVAATTG